MILDVHGQPFPSAREKRPPAARALSPYMAVNASPMRQPLWTFAEDTSRMVTPRDRIELMLLSRTLVENTAAAKALWTVAKNIGALRPIPRSGDDAWDKLAKKAFDARAYSPRIFDAGGRWNFETFQVFSTLARWRDGDLFAILTQTDEGGARIAVREGHCVASPPGAKSAEWNDGVRINKDTFPLGYNFRAGKVGKYLDHTSVHHFAQWVTEGGARGVPALAHALNHIRDRGEIWSYLKDAIKIAAKMGLSPKSAEGMLAAGGGIGDAGDLDPFAPPDHPQTGEAREERTVQVETVMNGTLMAPEPMEVLVDPRPHPNVMTATDKLLEEVAIGLGVSPAIMYFMRGANGPEARIDLDSFLKFILAEYAWHLIPFCQRFWTYFISLEMKAGRLPYPSKGDGFWQVRWAIPRNITADIGRIGKLNIDMLKHRMLSYQSHFEALGLYWLDEFRQMAIEARAIDDLETEFGLKPGRLSDALRITGLPTEAAPAAAA